MHLPVKSKTMDEAIENDHESANSEQDPPREKFYCDICGKYYDKIFETVHVQMHSGEEKYNCTICNKVFPNEESLTMHMNAHQESRVVSFFLLDFFILFFIKRQFNLKNPFLPEKLARIWRNYSIFNIY